MRRREFIALLTSAALAWPIAARSQQPRILLIGFLGSGSPTGSSGSVAALRQGLNESGYIEGQNVTIEYRWAEGNYDRLPVLTADLVGRQVNVLVADALPAALAAKAAVPATIPIVFVTGADPVELGLVNSLNRPGGNATGVSLIFGALWAKRMELLRELVPAVPTVAVIVNPNNPNVETNSRDLQAAANAIGQQIEFSKVSTERDLDTAFATLVHKRAAAALIGDDPFFDTRRHQFVTLAARYAVPTIYFRREFVAAGGLISYGPHLMDAVRQIGVYTARILKGTKPADLPVMLPTKFELAINLKTAKALGLKVPPTLLATADEVIE